jgi:hypothetical protein
MEGGMRKKIEGGKMGLRPLEERFRLRSSSYAPTSRLRLEAKELKTESSKVKAERIIFNY